MPDTTQTNIATEITRIQNDRNTIRTKLVELGNIAVLLGTI